MSLEFFDFPRSSDRYVEANNLNVSKRSLSLVNDCLDQSVVEDTFLTRAQLQQVQACGIDISKLDPTGSALWNENAPNSIELKEQSKTQKYFPRKETIVDYKKMRFSGFG